MEKRQSFCLVRGLQAKWAMPIEPDKLQEIFLEEIQDLYDAEKQITKALPAMAKAATSDPLKQAFIDHLEVTKKQAERLEQIFEVLGEKPQSRPCQGMAGIVGEGRQHMEEYQNGPLIDTVLAGGGKKVEHYEIAAYNGALELAQSLGNRQAARLLLQTLREEERMDRKLAQLSARLLKSSGKAQKRAA